MITLGISAGYALEWIERGIDVRKCREKSQVCFSESTTECPWSGRCKRERSRRIFEPRHEYFQYDIVVRSSVRIKMYCEGIHVWQSCWSPADLPLTRRRSERPTEGRTPLTHATLSMYAESVRQTSRNASKTTIDPIFRLSS